MGFMRSGGAPEGAARAAMLARIQIVRAYWEGLRGPGGALPDRAMIDPRGMAKALESVFVAEGIGPGLMRLRIAGAALGDLCGLDMKGMPLSALFTPSARDRLADQAAAVLAGHALSTMELTAERGLGQPGIEARLVLLPLRRTGGPGHLVLGCLAIAAAGAAAVAIGRAPRRFDIQHVAAEPLLISPSPAQPPAPPQRGPEHRPDRKPGERPRLRLVHSTG